MIANWGKRGRGGRVLKKKNYEEQSFQGLSLSRVRTIFRGLEVSKFSVQDVMTIGNSAVEVPKLLCEGLIYLKKNTSELSTNFHIYNSILLTGLTFNCIMRGVFVHGTDFSLTSVLFKIVHKNLYCPETKKLVSNTRYHS